jgi:cytochrome c-type biogenesis protein CcsB
MMYCATTRPKPSQWYKPGFRTSFSSDPSRLGAPSFPPSRPEGARALPGVRRGPASKPLVGASQGSCRPESSKGGRRRTCANLFTPFAARALTLLLTLFSLSLPAFAQTAPAGNAHPKTQEMTADAENLPNPFGDPIWPTTTTTESKRALYAAVDSTPLRDLAVFHNGRVKIFDTLAREMVSTITGRKNYFETSPTTDAYSPVFTYLDLMIDPAYYVSKPLIGIEYLPLRQDFLKLAFPNDEAQQQRWLKLTRISPSIAAQFARQIGDKHDFEPPYRTGLGKLSQAFELYEHGAANLLMVAPETKDEPWRHISALPADAPARQAAMKLGQAWRAGDAPSVNAAIAALAAELPKIHPELYPTTKRSLEMAYNKSNAFEWGFWAYGLAFVSLLLAFGTGRAWLKGVGITTLSLAVALHAFGFISRCLIAERFAIQNQFESMTGVSLFGAVVALSIMLIKRQWLFGAAAAALGFLILITATQSGIPGVHIEREAAILNTSVLLKYHVTTVLCSYGLITLGFIVSLFYLGTFYAQRLRATPSPSLFPSASSAPLREIPSFVAAQALGLDDAQAAGPARTLSDLDKAQMTVLQLAFWTLGVGICLGAWWADHSWGRFWAFDPKETWALATWIIYLIVVHVRVAGPKNRGLITAWLSVLGFIVMLWTYFGVNLLLPGLHAYA